MLKGKERVEIALIFLSFLKSLPHPRPLGIQGPYLSCLLLCLGPLVGEGGPSNLWVVVVVV